MRGNARCYGSLNVVLRRGLPRFWGAFYNSTDDGIIILFTEILYRP